jgi:hypothetical protein
MWGVGPMASYRPSEAWLLSASVRYTVTEFSTAGAIQDTAAFEGLTFMTQARWQMTEVMTHGVSGGRMVGTGMGSNFTENLFANYTVGWQFSRNLGVDGGFAWTRFKQSGVVGSVVPVIINGQVFNIPVTFVTSDEADIYAFNVGTSYQWSERLSSGLRYMHANQESLRYDDRSFTQNMVMLNLTYRF